MPRQAEAHLTRAAPRRSGLRGLLLGALLTLFALSAAPVAHARQSVSLTADNVFVDSAGRLVATGAVEVWHGSVRMTARRIVYDRRRNHLSIEGPITLNDGPDRLFLADQADLSTDLRDGLIRSARLVLDQQLQVAAASIRREDANLTHMESVIASSCPVCAQNPTPLWEIRAARVRHDQSTRQLYFEHAQFRFRGIPLFYSPRLRLPDPTLTRSAGFLLPVVGLQSQLGVGIGLPYFMPIGPDRDLLLTPHFWTSGALSLGLRYRQAFASGGIEFSGQIARDNILPGAWRGYGQLRGLFELPDDYRLSFDVIVPSDRTFLDTYGVTDDDRLQSHVTVERIRRDQIARVRALAFRSLASTAVNAELPNLVGQAEWERRVPLSVMPGGILRTRFWGHAHHRRSTTPGDDGRDIARLGLEAEWRRQEILPGGIVATGALVGRAEHIRIADDPGFAPQVTRASAEAMVELRWPWTAADSRGAGYLIEPVVQLIGSARNTPPLPNDDHMMPELDPGNLFALRRYSGQDARDDGSRANLGLRWARHDPAGWSAEALVGRILRTGGYDGFSPANPQPFGQARSNWLLAGQFSTGRALSMGIRVLLDDAAAIRHGETSLRWNWRQTDVNSAYVFLRSNPFENRTADSNDWLFDVSHSFGNGFRGRLGWQYDLAGGQFVTASSGIEYRGDCMLVDVSLSRRFVSSTMVTPSTQFGLRVELLGIGGARATPTGRACRT